MKIGITGATGLIGHETCSKLQESNHQLRLFVRRRTGRFTGSEEIECDLLESPPSTSALDGLDALVHLAGESIAAGRWTAARKKRIWDSRIIGTRNLVNTCLNHEKKPPATLICASAIGFYGDRGDKILAEDSSGGSGWLANLTRQWEKEALRLETAGVRVILLRIGIVLSLNGGALAKMLTPFRMGLGGRLGDGKQYMSWIHIADIARLIQFALENESLSGPVNAVSNSTTNLEFTKTLARTMRRPSLFPTPARILKIALGEMAEALLLSGQKVIPQKARKAGFRFQFSELEPALKDLFLSSP